MSPYCNEAHPRMEPNHDALIRLRALVAAMESGLYAHAGKAGRLVTREGGTFRYSTWGLACALSADDGLIEFVHTEDELGFRTASSPILRVADPPFIVRRRFSPEENGSLIVRLPNGKICSVLYAERNLGFTFAEIARGLRLQYDL